MNNFIQQNKNFWQEFKINEGDKKILIEEPCVAMIAHVNAISALILNQAKNYAPIWLYGEKCLPKELLESYINNAKIINNAKKNLSRKIYVKLIALLKFLKIYLTSNILGVYYDGVKYGDIIYDTYLANNHVATIRKIDFKLINIIASCIHRHIQIKNILKKGNYAGVLVSHQVGINGGVMLRAALRYGYKGYLRCGHHQSTLQCFERNDEVYDYEYKPFPSDIDEIINHKNINLEEKFLEIFKLQLTGKGTKDAIYAFSSENKYYKERTLFNQNHNLNFKKKNIFIMLHAFNDHPHSHFRWMIFKDYYDWFYETLKYAKTNNKVNWIFKQHPSIRHYPMKDICMDEFFIDCPDNVIYIDEKNQIDTRSLVYCADLVVTCLGSVGFELPAMGGIPSMTASDNFYTNLGFAIEPKTKKEYFNILNNAHNIEKLSQEQQKRARASYIYIHDISRVNFLACPILSLDDEKKINDKNWYWEKILEQYRKKGNDIKQDVKKYIHIISDDKFKRLIKL